MVQSWTADRVREFLRGKAQGDVNIIDVRQPDEFEEERMPGAHLIPLGELPDRLAEVDRSRPTIVYCRRGGRGSAGASVLMNAGFPQVVNLEGGLSAWNGQCVAGTPDAGAMWFAEAATLDDYVAQAWDFEEGARIFYEQAAALSQDEEAVALFRGLGKAEVFHKAALLDLHRKLTGDESADLSERDLSHPDVMEGGAPLSEALAWIEGRPTDEVLEFAMALEATAYDRYVQLCRRQTDGAIRAVFRLLADAEKKHLEELTTLFAERR